MPISLKFLGVKKINVFVVSSSKLTNHFACLDTSGLGPDVARGRLSRCNKRRKNNEVNYTRNEGSGETVCSSVLVTASPVE
jgi:hypothetical protein